MTSFISEVVSEIVNRHASLLSDFLFIVPSKRAGGFLKKNLAEQIQRPILSPHILSIEQFIAEISNLDAVDTAELLFLLYQSYIGSDIKTKDDFYAFSKWAGALLQDFNEIDRYLVNADDFFSYMSALKKIKSWNLKKESTLISNYLGFWRELQSIYEDFHSRLLSKNIAYQGLMYRKAFEKLDEYLEKSNYKKFIFIGFNALNTAESEVIKYLLQNKDTEIYWDLDTYFYYDKAHSASFFIRKYKREWTYFKERPLIGFSSNFLSAKKHIKIIGAAKNISQAKYVGQLIKKVYDPTKKTALVLSDESLLQPILNSLPKEVDEINITMGSPLEHTHLHSFFMGLFEMHIKKTERGFFYQEVLQVLSNSYTAKILMKNGADHASRIKSAIEKYNWMFIHPKHLLVHHPNPAINTVFFENSNKLSHFLDQCTALIAILIEQSKNEEHSEYVLFTKFSKILEQLKKHIKNHSFIKDLKTAQQLYLELVANEQLDYQGNPDRGLQIMGMLESRNLDFDTVIITSVNEGILPSGKSNNSFIPYDVKREFGMPTYREKDAVYAYHFYRLLQRPKEIYILYNTEPDVLEGGEKSRFISQLLTDGNINGSIEHVIAATDIKITAKKAVEIIKAPALLESIGKVSQEGFSPTSLSSYVRNPLGFYKERILKIKPLEPFDDSMALNTFGTIVHDVLEEVFKPFEGAILNADVLQSCKRQIPELLNHSFLKTLPNSNLSEGKNLIIYNVILKYLENFLDAEIEQAKNHNVKILALEQNLTSKIHLVGQDSPVILKGKLGRVDEKDGQLRIIDYKTGSVEASEIELMDWDALITEPKYAKAFQLLCYAKMYLEEFNVPNLEAGIIPIKKTNAPFLRFATKESAKGPKDHVITKDVIQNFNVQLEKLILEILNPQIPFIEKEQ